MSAILSAHTRRKILILNSRFMTLFFLGFRHGVVGFHPVSFASLMMFLFKFQITTSMGGIEVVSSSMGANLTHLKRFLVNRYFGFAPYYFGALT